MRYVSLVTWTFVIGSALAFGGSDDPIPAEEARSHIGEKRVVLMKVMSSKDEQQQKVYYLDSEKSYKDEKNLAVVISYDDRKKFSEAGIENPVNYYKKGTKLRVTGKIIREEDQTRIRVSDPSQIQIVKD